MKPLEDLLLPLNEECPRVDAGWYFPRLLLVSASYLKYFVLNGFPSENELC